MSSTFATAPAPAAVSLSALLQHAESVLIGGNAISPLLAEAHKLAGNDHAALARIALLHGMELWRSGEPRQALRHWIDAEALAQAADDPLLMAEAWLEIANWHRLHNDAHRALRLHEHALTLAGQAESPALQALCLLALAADAHAIAAPDTARLATQQALTLRDAIPPGAASRWHEQLAALHLLEGNLPAAEEELRQLLPAQSGRARLGTLLQLGQIALQHSEPDEALTLLQEGHALADPGDPLACTLHDTLAVALEQSGQVEAAVQLRRQLRAQRQAAPAPVQRQGRLHGLELKLQLLTSELEVAQLRTEAELERQKLQLLETSAYRDPLTGLPNRLYLNERLPEMLEATRESIPLSLLLIDCDCLKDHAEQFGEGSGDDILVCLSHFLMEGYSDAALLVRHGHSTFALLLPGIVPETALRLAEQIRQRIAGSDWASLWAGLQVTASIGHAAALADDTMDILLLRADLAMYLAKRQGGNCVCDGDQAT